MKNICKNGQFVLSQFDMLFTKQYNPEAYGVCTYVHTIRLYSTIHIHDPSHYWFVTINKHFNDNSVNN